MNPLPRKYLPAVLCAALCLAGPGVAQANDASLDLSGTPRLMAGHPSVTMQSEVISLVVGRESVVADCRLVFVNTGSACTVRMGFPDDSWERDSSTPEDAPFKSSFTSFQSYVDGKVVPTRVESGPQANGLNTIWRVKSVAFGTRGKSRSTRRVREKYTVPIGGEMTFLSKLAGYTLHTGASWKGPIGRSEITARFDRPLKRGQMRAISMAALNTGGRDVTEGDTMGRIGEALRRTGTVVYEGPGRAQVLAGHRLRWVRTKWRPTRKDDIVLYFKMP